MTPETANQAMFDLASFILDRIGDYSNLKGINASTNIALSRYAENGNMINKDIEKLLLKGLRNLTRMYQNLDCDFSELVAKYVATRNIIKDANLNKSFFSLDLLAEILNDFKQRITVYYNLSNQKPPNMKQPRTGINFNNWTHERELFTSKDGSEIIVDQIQSTCEHKYKVCFTNACGKLSVTGSFGNWIFDHNTIPSNTARLPIDDEYWCEKLIQNGSQDPYRFDPEATLSEFSEWIEEEKKDPNHRKEDIQDLKDYKDLVLGSYDLSAYKELEYLTRANGDLPECLDASDIPHVQIVDSRLNVVFDAFEEICRRRKA